MAKIDSTLSALEKLYAKRDALDKQIIACGKKLAAEVKAASKPTALAKKPTAKKVAPSKPLIKK